MIVSDEGMQRVVSQKVGHLLTHSPGQTNLGKGFLLQIRKLQLLKLGANIDLLIPFIMIFFALSNFRFVGIADRRWDQLSPNRSLRQRSAPS